MNSKLQKRHPLTEKIQLKITSVCEKLNHIYKILCLYHQSLMTFKGPSVQKKSKVKLFTIKLVH